MNIKAEEHPVPALPPNGQSTMDHFVESIHSAYTDSIAAVFEMGDLLISAKRALAATDFNNMIETKLPFGKRTAERLMKIAGHVGFPVATHVSLPPSWGTLHVLTGLKPKAIAKEISAGGIHADMERKDAEALVDKYKEGKPKSKGKGKGKGKNRSRKRPSLMATITNLRTEIAANEAYIQEMEATRAGPTENIAKHWITLAEARAQYAELVVALDGQEAIAAELEKLKQLIISEASQADAGAGHLSP